MSAEPRVKPTAKRQALGRGLSALLPAAGAMATGAEGPATGYRLLPIEQIEPHKNQPRKLFEEGPLLELAASIKAQGVLQPVVVRRLARAKFQLVAGERRWRAAQMAGLKEIPAVVKELTDVRAMQVALIENIQREDLDPLEEALAYRRLLEEHELRQEDLALAVGKNRTAITHSLRLLRLPDELLELVASSKLSPGHARALLQLPKNTQRLQVAAEILRQAMSVRQAEQRVRELVRATAERKRAAGAKAPAEAATLGTRDLLERLQRALGTRVGLRRAKEGSSPQGVLEISYSSYEQLEAICERLLAR